MSTCIFHFFLSFFGERCFQGNYIQSELIVQRELQRFHFSGRWVWTGTTFKMKAHHSYCSQKHKRTLTDIGDFFSPSGSPHLTNLNINVRSNMYTNTLGSIVQLKVKRRRRRKPKCNCTLLSLCFCHLSCQTFFPETQIFNYCLEKKYVDDSAVVLKPSKRKERFERGASGNGCVGVGITPCNLHH